MRCSFRPAIAMIELIFAIVVIGITLLSAPLVLNQSIQSNTIAIQQESVAAVSTQISLIMTHNWDENDSNTTTGYNIINVVGGDTKLNFGQRDLDSTYSTRDFNATLSASLESRFGVDKESQDFNPVLGRFVSDDIDDFDGQTRMLTLYATEAEALTNDKGEYLDQNIIMSDTVTYGVDVPTTAYSTDPVQFNNPFTKAPSSTNIKLISVTLSSTSNVEEHNKSITMSAFSCNIGTPSIRTIPLN